MFSRRTNALTVLLGFAAILFCAAGCNSGARTERTGDRPKAAAGAQPDRTDATIDADTQRALDALAEDGKAEPARRPAAPNPRARKDVVDQPRVGGRP